MEEHIAEDRGDKRAQKATQRLEHFLAQKIAEGEEKGERDNPRDSEPNIEKQEGPDIAIDSPMETEHFESHSPVRPGQDSQASSNL